MTINGGQVSVGDRAYLTVGTTLTLTEVTIEAVDADSDPLDFYSSCQGYVNCQCQIYSPSEPPTVPGGIPKTLRISTEGAPPSGGWCHITLVVTDVEDDVLDFTTVGISP